MFTEWEEEDDARSWWAVLTEICQVLKKQNMSKNEITK